MIAATDEQAATYHNQTAILTWLRSLGHDASYVADPAVPSIHLPPAHWSIGHACPYCGVTMTYGGRYSVTKEHKHPKSRGGILTAHNRLIVCAVCNHDKANRTLEEWHAILQRRNDDRAPRVLAIVIAERTRLPPPANSASRK